jgi:cytidine deaminase
MPTDVQDLVRQAVEFEMHMHPIRNLELGTILLDNGEVILGSDQENAAYPSGLLCAERVAIFMLQMQSIPMQKF